MPASWGDKVCFYLTELDLKQSRNNRPMLMTESAFFTIGNLE